MALQPGGKGDNPLDGARSSVRLREGKLLPGQTDFFVFLLSLAYTEHYRLFYFICGWWVLCSHFTFRAFDVRVKKDNHFPRGDRKAAKSRLD